jgi:hypothetical protein
MDDLQDLEPVMAFDEVSVEPTPVVARCGGALVGDIVRH